jgi:DNA-binding transcriptional LysR family regulator
VAGLRIERIRSFVAVAESPSYEAAAEILGVTQPTVWKRVDELRKELGFDLFHANSVRLTRSGSELLPMAKRLIKDEEELARLAHDLDQGVTGAVTIACYPAHVNRFIAEVSSQFKSKFPETRIFFPPHKEEGTAGRELVEQLLNHEVDLAVGQRRAGDPPVKREGLDGRKIYEVRLVVVLPDDHPDRVRATVTAQALRGESLVLPPAGYFTRIQVDRVFREGGFEPKIGAENGSWMALLAMGRSGVGIPIVPDDALNPDESYPALVDAEGGQIIKELWLLWRLNEPMNPTVKNFIQFVNSFCDERTLT